MATARPPPAPIGGREVPLKANWPPARVSPKRIWFKGALTQTVRGVQTRPAHSTGRRETATKRTLSEIKITLFCFFCYVLEKTKADVKLAIGDLRRLKMSFKHTIKPRITTTTVE